MTAYKNRKAALAVTAGLVGALTLGGAAVAVTPAFADDAQAGATMQSSWTTGSSVTAATNGKGQAVADPANASFEAGSGNYLVPTTVTNKFGSKTQLTNPADYTFFYTNAANQIVAIASNGFFGWADSTFETAAQGTYKVTVVKQAGADYYDYHYGTAERVSQTFELTNPTSVKGIKSEGSVTYDGANSWKTKDLNLVDAKGNKLQNVSNDPSKDGYEVQSVTKKGAGTVNPGAKVEAGTYTVSVGGRGTYAGTNATLTITVNPLDLSKAVVMIHDFNGTVDYTDVQAHTQILGYAGNLFSDAIVDEFVGPDGLQLQGPDGAPGSWSSTAKGEYTAVISGKGDGNLVNSAKVTFHNYSKDAGSLFYGKNEVVDRATMETGILKFDLTAEAPFDESKLAIRDAGHVKYQKGFTVQYVNKTTGQLVDASALAKPGEYEAYVHANVTDKDANGDVVCGSYKLDITVVGNKLNSSQDVAWFFDGEQKDDAKAEVGYDGTDAMKRLGTMVIDGDLAEYKEGVDYHLVLKKAGYGAELKEAVDAGKYTVTVVGDTFEFANGNPTFTLTIDPVKVSDLGRKTGLKDQTVTYTGRELDVPQAQYLVVNADGSKEYKPLDKALYKVDTIKDAKTGKVAKLQKAGKYAVTISLTDAAKGNFQLVDRDFIVTVREATSFDDVAADAWYAEPVEKAYDNGYVNGFAGTRLFGPERQITRADAVCILFNMAGGKDMSDGLFDYNASTGYETGFKDVNGKAYYAKALAWANETDVANGYGDGTFKPEAQITREEFAALLSNYAKLKGEYEAPTGDLSSFEDASSVSGWATEVVEWAVENGVLGNGGFLAGDAQITRAEVAAMAVNYQPKPVKNPVFSKFDK